MNKLIFYRLGMRLAGHSAAVSGSLIGGLSSARARSTNLAATTGLRPVTITKGTTLFHDTE